MTSTDNILWNWGAVLLLVAGWYAFWLFGRNAARKLETARVATVPADGPPEALTLVRAVDPTNFLRKFAVLIDARVATSLRVK